MHEFYCLRMCSSQLEAEWRAEIQKSIPRLTKALKGSDVETTLIQLSRLAKIPQLRGEVRAALPSLIALLKDPNRRVRGCALEALSSLARFTSTSSTSRKLALHGLSEVAQFAIPLMIAAVQDSDVALEASHSLLRLAKLVSCASRWYPGALDHCQKEQTLRGNSLCYFNHH
ncbi:hypothetical protein B0H14DRAFT_2815345 [Mycena olivaceomarginata]|nr:hypothetical protein B0H14DRAFT_2815345 [Mycena olivaceomarginata]